MPDTDPTSHRVLALFADLMDAEPDVVEQTLDGECPQVRDEVRALLSIDEDAPELEHDAMALALALDLGDEPVDTPLPPDAPPGYDLHELLGRGGMGEVYRATQHAPRREVALKFVDQDALDEAQALADANLSTVPSVYEVGRHRGRGFLSMERVQGEPLDRWAREHDAEARLALLESLCRGVHRMHQRGVVHRDLKPAHVLVAEGDRPRLLDFGLAFHVDTGASGTAGTLRYMADEVLDGGAATERSDVFSLTCILVEVMSGQPAMPDATLPSQQRRARTHWERPKLGFPLDAVVRRGLAPAPERYPDAAALADDLERIRHGRLPHATPISAGTRIAHVWRTNRARIVPSLAVLGVLVVGVVWWTWTLGQAERRADDLWTNLLEHLPEQPEGGLRELEGFLALPSVQGTTAANRARLAAAELHHQLGDIRGERRALASVYADGDGTLRDRAAILLAQRFREERNWRSLDAILPSVPDPTLRAELEVAAAVGLRAWDRPAARTLPLFDTLRHAQRTSVRGNRWSTAGASWGALTLDAFSWGTLEASLPTAGSLPLPVQVPGGPAWMVDVDGPLVVAPVEDRHTARLLRPEGDHWVPVASASLPGKLFSVAAGDPNLDGVPTVFLGTAPDTRTLRAIEPPHWTPRAIAPDLDAVASDVEHIRVVDLDRDGRLEVVVHVGAWQAHDLRIYHQQADGDLALVDRVRLGGLARTAVLDLPSGERRLAVVKVDRYPNPALFGTATPYGDPAGLYVYAFDGRRLELEHTRPLPGATLHGQELHGGDFDGDGLPDLVAHTEHGALLLQLDARARVRAVHAVEGLEVVGAYDVDSDGAQELIARVEPDPNLWVLGAGDETLPSLERSRSDDGGPLERLGLYDEAAERHATLATLVRDPTGAAAEHERASELYVASGAHRAALASIDEAVRLAPTPARYEKKASLLATLALYDRMHEIPAPHQRLPEGELEATVLDFTGPLPPVHWERPTALRHLPGRGLDLQTSTGDDVLFSLPVERTADAVAIEVDLELLHAEGGADLTVSLVGPDGVVLEVGTDPWGGARQITRKTHCVAGGLANDLGRSATLHHDLDRTTHHRLRVASDPDGLLCLLEQGPSSQMYRIPLAVELPEQMTLRVHMERGVPAAHLRGRLRSLSLLGLRPQPVADDSGATALVSGAYREALKTLADPIARAEVLGRMGRTDEAREALAATEVLPDADLLPALRRQPEVWLDLLASHAPERLPGWIARAFTVAYTSGDSQDVDRMVVRPDLDRLPLDEPEVITFLLVHAARLVEADRPERALQVYQRIATVEDPARVDALLGIAVASVRRGDPEAAHEACTRARAVPGQPPYLLEDRIAASADLRPVCSLLPPETSSPRAR